MRNPSDFHRDYVAALVQLSQQEITVRTPQVKRKVRRQAIKGVRIAEQIAASQQEQNNA